MKVVKISQTENQAETIFDSRIFGIFNAMRKARGINWKFHPSSWTYNKTSNHWRIHCSGFFEQGSVFTVQNPPVYVVAIHLKSAILAQEQENEPSEKKYVSAQITLWFNKKRASIPMISDMDKVAQWVFEGDEVVKGESLKIFLQNQFQISKLKLPNEIETEKIEKLGIQINKKFRLTRVKRQSLGIFASALEIFITPKALGGHEISYQITNLETSVKDPKLLIAEENEDGSPITNVQALERAKDYIDKAIKNRGYVEEGNRSYIPEGADFTNFDFNTNRWLKKPSSEEEKSAQVPEHTSLSPEEMEELRSLISKSKHQYVTAQNFEGYFSGNVPEYATQFLGTTAIEASQIEAMFGKAHEAVKLVNQFDSSLLYNISFIFNFAKSGAYGVYLSELDRAIKTSALKKKLEQKGYDVKSTDQGLTAFPKQGNEISPDVIQKDIDAIYSELESKGGTAIGINMNAVLNAAKQDSMESGAKDSEMWQWIAILHLGGTIVHEAVHAKGHMDEGPSEQVEQNFTQWALPKVNEIYKQSLVSQGKEEEFTPLAITSRQRHANSKNWYRTAQLSYYMPHAFVERATGSDLGGRFPVGIQSDLGTAPWSMMAQEGQKAPIESRLGRQYMSKIPKDLSQEHDIIEEQLRKYTREDKKLDPNASMEELLSEGWDEDRGYTTLEGLLDEKRPKPLLVPLKQGSKLNNLEKHSQFRYTVEAVKTTKDPSILTKILRERKNNAISYYAALNLNCPPEMLVEILREGRNDGVSYNAAKNPNCPPEMLAEVLRRGNSNAISCSAARNRNCPPEILAEVLRRGNNDWVSRYAALNPDCPPEILAEVLRRGNNDEVSWSAANNRNCPPEALVEAVRRGNGNVVSRMAFGNPNYPSTPSTPSTSKERNWTDEQKEMLDLLSHNKKMTKTATLFRWMNNLSISDGNTIPGLGDRVMAWDDRDSEGWDEDRGYIILENLLDEKRPKPLLVPLRQGSRSNNIQKYSQSWYTKEVAKNTTDPQVLTEILRGGNDDCVSCNAASNSHCPPEMLVEVLKSGKNDTVSQFAALNPNCPPEALAEVLRRGKDDWVSRYAAKNPNCPPKASFEWMRETGKITKFDPKKHVREFSDKVEEQEDSDIKKIEGLLGNSKFNLKKYSQSWYTKEVAKNTTDPQVLTEILRRGNDDNVSWYAASNSDCPPEMLVEVLRREKNNSVSYYAVFNPNCPPEMLVEVLRRGKDDSVACYAARNPNCPPEILVEVLRRGKDDNVSCYAVQNPNCPSEMLVEILKRGKDDLVSERAAQNPNCPPIASVPKEVSKERNWTDEQKEMLDLLSHNKKMTKTATLFGWMNNLSISDGNTIPGLGDRVMAWDDRDEDFAEEESWIEKQPRYNPTYDLKGFYYRWIEPRNQPQLFDDMTRDYSNTHPAKRFASVKVDPEVARILTILSRAKSKITNKEIKSTRFVMTEDLMPLIDSIFTNGFKILVFHFGETDQKEDILAVWISAQEVEDETIEKIEKHLQKKSVEKDVEKLLDELTGIYKRNKEISQRVVNVTDDACASYEIKGLTKKADKLEFQSDCMDHSMKVGGLVAEKLGVRNVKIRSNSLSFVYQDAIVRFGSKKKER